MFSIDKSLKPLVIPFKKAIKKSHKKNGTTYDTRVYIEFDFFALSNAKQMSRVQIKFRIKGHKKKDKILLIGDRDTLNIPYVRGARRMGFKKIFCSSYN